MSKSAVKHTINLKGSAAIIRKYLDYSLNSILFQRGVYPSESFVTHQKYGLNFFMCKDEKVQLFFKKRLKLIEGYIAKDQISEISLVIFNKNTHEDVEFWDFDINSEQNNENRAPSPVPDVSNKDDVTKLLADVFDCKHEGPSETLRIQEEIKAVMRLFLRFKPGIPYPSGWRSGRKHTIENAQTVPMTSFSTGLQKVSTSVTFKSS